MYGNIRLLSSVRILLGFLGKLFKCFIAVYWNRYISYNFWSVEPKGLIVAIYMPCTFVQATEVTRYYNDYGLLLDMTHQPPSTISGTKHNSVWKPSPPCWSEGVVYFTWCLGVCSSLCGVCLPSYYTMTQEWRKMSPWNLPLQRNTTKS